MRGTRCCLSAQMKAHHSSVSPSPSPQTHWSSTQRKKTSSWLTARMAGWVLTMVHENKYKYMKTTVMLHQHGAVHWICSCTSSSIKRRSLKLDSSFNNVAGGQTEAKSKTQTLWCSISYWKHVTSSLGFQSEACENRANREFWYSTLFSDNASCTYKCNIPSVLEIPCWRGISVIYSIYCVYVCDSVDIKNVL